MKNKQVTALTRFSRKPHVDGLTLGEQIDAILNQSTRQAMSERIKAGIARKRDRDAMKMTNKNNKSRTKQHAYNVTKVRQPHPIKTRN